MTTTIDGVDHLGALLGRDSAGGLGGGVRVAPDVTVEVRGAPKPPRAAQVVFRYSRR